MTSTETTVNSFMDIVKNENGIIMACVSASIDPQNPKRVLLTKHNREGQYPIGYADVSAINGGKTPLYDNDMIHTQHHLLQKTIDKNGNKSLLYMLPIQNENNQLLGAYLFQKTKVGENEVIEFKGSVSPQRYDELKKKQIPEQKKAMAPFKEKYHPIVADTTLPLLFDHYGAPSQEPSKMLKAFAYIKTLTHQNG